jgi:hexosaminidase
MKDDVMNTLTKKLSMTCLVALLTACGPSGGERPAAVKPKSASPLVIPVPAEFSSGAGSFPVSADTTVVFSGGQGASEAAHYFAQMARQDPQITVRPPREDDSESKAIAFVIAPNDASFGPEAYSIVSRSDGVTVKARTPAGLFYGAVSLWQLLTVAPPQSGIGQVPALEIKDAPRFTWRGLMLDSARHYQSPEYIKKFIDNMAQHKLNVLHWHLTDDQAWRLEIKKYPKLTSVGGWRVPAGQAPRADIDPKTGKPRLHGGIYTQAQARDIVAFAASRHIKVVPEIEMPGHASAAIVAYPELGVAPFAARLKEVPSDWGVYENLFNVEESTFKFLEDVLTEVIDVFPGEYIHVGGDEAVKPQWEQSPRVQARMKELGVPDAHHLQGYFIQRMAKFIESKGRRVIGWDEILEGGIPPNATIMSWRGIDGAIAAAKAGHDTVLSPAPDLYLDHWQSAGDLSPGRSNTLSLEMVYRFQPMPDSIPEEGRKHILGLQGNLWAEMMRTEARVDYMAFPRISALAEVAWSPAARIDWPDFQRRLDPQLRRYDNAAIVWAREVELRPQPLRRLSHDLEQCGEGYLLSLEDDAPIEGERAVFLVNITNPCWIWKGVDLSAQRSLRAVVGQIPFNFQIGEDAKKIPLHKPASADGEFEVRVGGCAGAPAGTASLTPAVKNFGLTPLPPIQLPVKEGTHDLCFRFTRAKVDPIWVIGSLELAGN